MSDPQTPAVAGGFRDPSTSLLGKGGVSRPCQQRVTGSVWGTRHVTRFGGTGSTVP